eukprot:778643-Pelagomonas_calceolata.AAC.2
MADTLYLTNHKALSLHLIAMIMKREIGSKGLGQGNGTVAVRGCGGKDSHGSKHRETQQPLTNNWALFDTAIGGCKRIFFTTSIKEMGRLVEPEGRNLAIMGVSVTGWIRWPPDHDPVNLVLRASSPALTSCSSTCLGQPVLFVMLGYVVLSRAGLPHGNTPRVANGHATCAVCGVWLCCACVTPPSVAPGPRQDNQDEKASGAHFSPPFHG